MDEADVKAEAERLLRIRRLLREELREETARSARSHARRERLARQAEPGGRALDAVDTMREALDDSSPSQELMERQAQARQAARGAKPLGFAFWDELGPVPICGPGEVHVARVFHRKILALLDVGGWTHTEQTYLTRMEHTWARRAQGKDVRFTLVGNKRGRLGRELEQKIKTLERIRS